MDLRTKFLVATCIAVVVLAFALFAGQTNKDISMTPESSEVDDAQQNSDNPVSAYDLAGVSEHATKQDCWTIIDAKLYDITSYIPMHPGGEKTILMACGKDGTEAFKTKGGRGKNHKDSTWNLLEDFYIADVGDTNKGSVPAENPSAPQEQVQALTTTSSTASSSTSTSPSTTTTIAPKILTQAEVAKHSSEKDCWIIINGKVYDVTAYIPFHPGGKNAIIRECGGEATQAFDTKGGEGRHSSNAKSLLNNYLIGDLGTTIQTTTSTTITTSAITTTSQIPSVTKAIEEEYPGALILDVDYEDDGRVEVKFSYEGRTYEAKLDAQHNIIKVE